MTPTDEQVEAVANAIGKHQWGDDWPPHPTESLVRTHMRDRARAAIAAMQPTVAQAADLSDLEQTQVGSIGNYYGCLEIRCVNGKPEWCIENYTGRDWQDCPLPVFAALRALTEPQQEDET